MPTLRTANTCAISVTSRVYVALSTLSSEPRDWRCLSRPRRRRSREQRPDASSAGQTEGSSGSLSIWAAVVRRTDGGPARAPGKPVRNPRIWRSDDDDGTDTEHSALPVLRWPLRGSLGLLSQRARRRGDGAHALQGKP